MTGEPNKPYRDVVEGRRSVRSYNPTFRIPREELHDLIKEATKAPSSSNLQPWRFLVIDDQALQEKLKPIAFNQQQVSDASAVIAVLGDIAAYKQAETISSRALKAGYITEEFKNRSVARTMQGYQSMSRDKLREIAYIDGGLVSMLLMLSAKARGYDTVPMGGYDSDAFVKAFEVPEQYVPIMLIAIGKAAAPGNPTIRLEVEEIAFWNSF
ncbi:MAG: nitroreductase family protein [Gorillibacterium sp.]|nr:nitroreductase family protein [Gorillibacterium sp.]